MVCGTSCAEPGGTNLGVAGFSGSGGKLPGGGLLAFKTGGSGCAGRTAALGTGMETAVRDTWDGAWREPQPTHPAPPAFAEWEPHSAPQRLEAAGEAG